MPGRPKKVKEGRDTGDMDNNLSQPMAGNQESQTLETPDKDSIQSQGAVLIPASDLPGQVNSPDNPPANSPTQIKNPASEFTCLLREALRDPEVKKGFDDIFWPRITTYVSETLKPIHDIVEVIDMDVDKLKEDVSLLKAKQETTTLALQNRITELERQSKACNLRMTGLEPNPIPGQPDATIHEKYCHAIINISTEAGMKDVKPSDFLNFTRINVPAALGASQTVIIKFSSLLSRDNMFSQRKLLKNCQTRHYLNEDLTKQDATQFKKARKQVKEGILVGCWTNKGVVWGKTSPEGKPFLIQDL